MALADTAQTKHGAQDSTRFAVERPGKMARAGRKKTAGKSPPNAGGKLPEIR
jgi:hypothetical protein